MVTNLLFPTKFAFYSFLSVFILFFCSIDVNAQCAGDDNPIPVPVCDISNVASQSIDLFSYLGGSPTAGGTWTDDYFSGGLNVTTGILNAQLINRSGIYTYTYTVNNVVGCTDNSATVTVTIGPYAGVGSKGNTCSDNTSYNLFQAFDIRVIAPQINGTWHDDDGSGGLFGSILDATIPVAGQTYRYTYTVDAVGACTQPSSQQIEVTIVPVPKPGTATDLKLCSDQLSSYTNYNLNNSLSGQDPNGTWSEIGTSEISGPTDSTIDIQNIYDTKGPGTYSFSYIVLGNGFCPRSATVYITIEKKLDFTGATLDVGHDICENEIPTATYTAVLTQGTQVIANGTYKVTYTISGVATPIVTTQNFVNGVLTFPIASSYFQQVSDYIITINNIADVASLGICTDIIGSISDVLHIDPIPKINSATLTIVPICQTEDATVEFSGTSNLADGNYDILFNLTGSNIATAIPAVLAIAGGIGTFPISKALIPKAGNNNIAITKITNTITGCTNTSSLKKDFIIKPLPDVSNLSVIVKNICLNQPAPVELSGLGSLKNITLSYDLTGVNNANNQTVSLVVSSGSVTFNIPSSSIPNLGNTILTITAVTNNLNGCPATVPSDPKNFTVNASPTVPTAFDQPFCKTDNPMVSNLEPSGNQYKWFNSATSTTALSDNALLVTGNYWVREVDTATECKSESKKIGVAVNEVPTPILKQDGEKFCGIDNPTIQNLTANVTPSATIVWFDSPTNGNQFANTELLTEGTTYYGFDFSSTTNCYSSVLPVTVSLRNCTATPSDLIVADGFSPNGDNVNDSFRIPDIEFTFPNFSLEIFNRYGNLMFNGNINKPEWDGKNSNSDFIAGDAPTGVYFYIIHYNKDNLPPQQGQLYLNR